jgi:hypothetical protein
MRLKRSSSRRNRGLAESVEKSIRRGLGASALYISNELMFVEGDCNHRLRRAEICDVVMDVCEVGAISKSQRKGDFDASLLV